MARGKGSARRARRRMQKEVMIYTMAAKQWLYGEAQNPNRPAWMRVGFLMLALTDCSGGMITFEPGEMARMLPVVDKATGELRPMDPSSLSRAIAQAKREGWLDPDSTAAEAAVGDHTIEQCAPQPQLWSVPSASA